MKGYAINSKVTYDFKWYPFLIMLGYHAEVVDWGKGHRTKFRYYHFLFWRIASQQAYIKSE